jgi:acyltransferase-like protein
MSRYPFPWTCFRGLALDLPFRSRSLVDDCRAMVGTISPPPTVIGVEHIPADGACLLVANHYQRRGLWIAWPGAVITLAIARRRRRADGVHWLVLGGLRIFQSRGLGPEIPFTRRILRAVADTYGMTALPLEGANERASALRSWLRALQNGEVVGMFPEGERGRAGALLTPEPALDRFFRLVRVMRVPVLPVGIWEEDDRLHVSLGSAMFLSAGDGRDAVMRAIAMQLPAQMRGRYGYIDDAEKVN